MLTVPSTRARVYVRPGPTDMRKQVNGLAALVERELSLSPFAEAVFVFCNRERRILKCLFWDKNGFVLWYKRLEKHRFPWPATGATAAREIDERRLALLLDGVDFWRAHEPLSYDRVT